LARHAALDVADPAPGVEPGTENGEHGEIRVYTRRLQRDERQASEAISQGRRARALTAVVQLLAMPREFTAVTATK
jgi:hypothetical protein